MNKKTKMWVGVGVVAAAAYYFWHKSQAAAKTPAATVAKFVGADGIFANAMGGRCPKGSSFETTSDGEAVCVDWSKNKIVARPK